MSKLPLDLSKFRKVKSDEHTSTLKHSDGHQLIIAHKRLSPKLRTQLDKLPSESPQKFAAGGSVDEPMDIQHPAQAPVVINVGQPQQQQIPPNNPPPQPQNPAQSFGRSAGQSVSDTFGALGSVAKPIVNAAGDFYKGLVGIPEAQGSIPESSVQVPAHQSEEFTNPGPAVVPEKQVNPMDGLTASLGHQMAGMQEVGAGQKAEAQAIGNQGLQSAALEQEHQKTAKSNLDAYTQASAPLLKARQDLMNDITNGHIDPKRYLDNMSTGGKISTAIGLILGGIGSGLTHGPSLAFQYLQNQIDRDINSQKDDLGKKQNLLTHNLQQTQDLREAYNLTKIQTNDVLSSRLRMIADQTADPVAKARLLQIQGMTDQQTAQLQHQMAMMKFQQQAFSGKGGTNMGMALEMFPEEKRERAVQMPGGGMRLAITKEGAKDVREQIQTIQPIFDSLDKLEKLGPSALIPGSPAAQQAEAIRAQLIPVVNENANLKRLSEEDVNNIKHMFTDPTKFSSLLGNSKTSAFKEFLQNKMMSTMGSQLEGGMPSSGGHQASSSSASGNFGFKPRKK